MCTRECMRCVCVCTRVRMLARGTDGQERPHSKRKSRVLQLEELEISARLSSCSTFRYMPKMRLLSVVLLQRPPRERSIRDVHVLSETQDEL